MVMDRAGSQSLGCCLLDLIFMRARQENESFSDGQGYRIWQNITEYKKSDEN